MIDVSLWAGSDHQTADKLVARVQAAAADGFGGIWVPQTAALDTLTALAVVAHTTPGIRLGTAVVPIQGRHPVPLALQALTVADVAGPGRFTLGVGVTHAVVSEAWFGVPYRDVVALCAEELQALSALLSPARHVDFDGQMLHVHVSIPMTVPPPGLVVAALGPRMIELAGRYADGTVTWMTGETTLGRAIVPPLRKAADAAGRPSPRVIAGLPVCVTDDVGKARDRLDEVMAGATRMPSYQRMLRVEGVTRPSDIALVGSEDEVDAHIERLGQAGVTELLANVIGSDDEVARTRQFLARR
jgi:F420-dependent oxidoreductase-like protein